jgi:molybdopterin-containing oxidoreductase family iron-sulfur binding subunit
MTPPAVDTLLILGANPVYSAPAALPCAGALPQVKTSGHLSFHKDETSVACTWHLPRAHYLEAWSDCLTWDGTYTIAQPLIHPIYEGKTPAEFLAFLLDGTHVAGKDLVRDAFVRRFGSDNTWRRAVHDGFVAGSAWSTVTPSFALASWKPRDADFAWEPKTEVVFFQDVSVYDGRFSNNGWLQEFPDPMTKLTWDNAALMNPNTARTLGVGQGDLIRLKYAGKTLDLPTFLMPGQAAGSIAVALGYGRRFGRVAQGSGFDVNPFRLAAAMSVAKDVEVSKAGGSYSLATTQSHHALFNDKQGQGEERRLPELFREGTVADFEAHPDFAKHAVHHPPLESLWKEHDPTTEHRWAMSIDLSACTGCGACVVACQAENNIAVVGKKEVSRGREMHWLRVDRYFRGDLDTPAVAHQVVVCMQCENAPCEQVCPVAATIHSKEGLNDMVYNRCVGTRYCSNNCPYKVRRFNWFNNQKKPYNVGELFKMKHNPDVTVRARGVMEKCTYCIQRIKAVTIPARNEKRPVKDGEIVTACAQTCPADAIVFGDLNDEKSRVRKLQDSARSYAMLEELNVKPRTKYLAKIRNPEGAPNHANSPESKNVHAG